VERVVLGFDALWATSSSEGTLRRVEPTPPPAQAAGG